VLALQPLIALLPALIAAVVAAHRYRGYGLSSPVVFLRALAWFSSLPGRGWVIGFGWALRFLVVFALPVVIGLVGLLVTWWLIELCIDNGANAWVLILVAIAVPGITVGGVAWGNQYGSGVSGGTPVGCLLLLPLAVLGGLAWFVLFVALLLLFALPGSLTLFALAGGRIRDDLEPGQWAIAIGVFLVMVVPPLVAERSPAFTAAGEAVADRLPFLGRRRRAHRRLASSLELRRARDERARGR